MVRNEYYDEIAALDEHDCMLLCLMAFKGAPLSADNLSDFRYTSGIKPSHLQGSMTTLISHGMAKSNNYYSRQWMKYEIKGIYYLPALKYMCVEHEEWLTKFKGYAPLNNQFSVMPKLVKMVIEGRKVPTNMKKFNISKDREALMVMGIGMDMDLVPLVGIFSDSQFPHVFHNMLVDSLNADHPIDEKIFNAMIDWRTTLSVKDKAYCQEDLALFLYLSTGKYVPAKRGLSYNAPLLEGIRYAHQGDYATAMKFLDKALKLRNTDEEIKNVFRNSVENFLLIALYIRLDDRKKLTQFLNKKLDNYTTFMPSVLLAESKVFPDKVSKKYLTILYKYSRDKELAILGAFAISMARLWDYPLDIVGNSDYLPQTAILRFEFQDLLPLGDDERKRLNDIYGTPIFMSVKPLPRWQRILEDIAKSNANPSTDGEQQREERIIYIVGGWHIEVRLQKRLKNGSWSAGKNISGYQYSSMTAGVSGMDDNDKAIYEMKGKTFYALKNEEALPKLIGSDRVFYKRGYSEPLEPVTIDEDQAYLSVDKGKNGITFSSNIEGVAAGKTTYIVKKSETHYSVVNLTHRASELYKELLQVGDIPLDGEKVLMDTLPAISRSVEIRSNLFKGKNALKTIEGSTKILIQARQDKADAYLVELLAKPLPDGKEHFIPGKGKPIVLDSHDGTPVQVKRKLKKEMENAEAALVFIDDDMTTEIDDYADQQSDDSYSRTLSTRGMLMLLEYVKPLENTFEVEWLEGKKIKTITAPTTWNVGLRQSGQWFEVEGNVQVDEKRVLSIAQLLQLMDFDGKSNYVKLGNNEYMMLTDALRRQLAKLEAIAMKDKDSLRIPVNNASLLADAMTGDINIANQEKLHEMVAKIKASYELKPRVPNNLNATLRDYQQEGFRWMARLDSWGAGACLADDMGLGKTVQTIAMLLYDAKKRASLVVAPTSVVSNWRNELSRFAPSLKVTLINELDSNARRDIIKKSSAREVILTTYGILSIEEEAFTSKEWNVLCLDEAHTIKNRDTKMAHAAHSLSAKTRIALTGTPLQNHLGELWSLFNFINPGLLGNYDMFKQKFVTPIESGNKTRQQQLRKIVLPFMLRRTKNEVIEELPDKTEIVRTVELSAEEMHAYETFRRSAKKKLEEEQKVSVSVLAEITKLRQAACAACLADKKLNYKSSKIEQLLQLVDNIGEDGNRILLFSQFTSFLKMVKEAFDKEKIEYLYLDGSTTMKQRAELVRRFQDGESRIFIISLKAGGLGLNLTGANYVIHMDPWWNPAIEQQATDRAYRIGQEQKVTVYHLISQHTIEEKILRLHQSKRDLADSLLEGADVSHKITEEDLNELLM